ncbi:MAG: response regulator [Anaerolineae bacterium]|nr:response regulator [Anaerolineae bacterium]
MPHPDKLRELIDIHTRRLLELKKQQAAYGLSADPSIVLEIETIEAEIQKLRTELGETEKVKVSAPARVPLAGKAVLVVEDNPAWQDILREYLAGLGCGVDLAVDFCEARDKLQAGHFDLVTIDAHLGPQVKAYEGMILLDYVRSRFGSDFPIIIVSGEINRRDLVRAFQKFGVTNVLLKENFEYDEFRLAVQNALQSTSG